MTLRSYPLTLPAGQRRSFPWQETSLNKRVPLLPSDLEGEEHEGIIRVPNHLCGTEPHTNQRIEFEQLLADNIARWLEWKRRRGWHVVSRPRVGGPYEVPQGRVPNLADLVPDHKWYIVRARFKREVPAYIKLEDFLHQHDLARRYNVDLSRPKPIQTPLPAPQDEINDSGEMHDPLRFAEERRRRLGINRKDYIIPEMWPKDTPLPG